MVLSDIIENLDHDNLTHILAHMQNSIEPTLYNPAKKYYLPEFFTIFEKYLIQDRVLNLKQIISPN